MNFSGCDSRAQSLHPFLSQTPSNQRRDGRLDQNWQGDLFGANLFPGPLFQEPADGFEQKLSDLILHILYVVVQFYPWFEFYLLLFQTHYHNYISMPKNKRKENLNQG